MHASSLLLVCECLCKWVNLMHCEELCDAQVEMSIYHFNTEAFRNRYIVVVIVVDKLLKCDHTCNIVLY